MCKKQLGTDEESHHRYQASICVESGWITNNLVNPVSLIIYFVQYI